MKEWFVGLLATALLAWFVWGWIPESTRLSWKYDTESGNVHISPRPQDCDYEYRPVGNKGCHYKKNVVTDPPDAHVWDNTNHHAQAVYVTWDKVQECVTSGDACSPEK
jgi:hypothetical protein